MGAAVAAAALFTADARADEQVNLKDGAAFRGELVERIPGDHVTLKLATGEIKTFRWNDLQEATAGAGGGAKLTLESDHENTTLLQLTNAGSGMGTVGGHMVAMAFESYAPVCTAPCTVAADPNGIYRIAGEGVTPSRTFRLPREGDVALRVHGGSAPQRAWGGAAAALGLTGVILGASFIGTAAILNNRDTGDFNKVGWISLGAGAAVTALGIILWITSGTDVTTASGQTLAKARVKLPASLSFSPQGLAF